MPFWVRISKDTQKVKKQDTYRLRIKYFHILYSFSSNTNSKCSALFIEIKMK